MAPSTQEEKFAYFIAEKAGICIVSLVGPIVRGSEATIEACSQALLGHKSEWVLVSFRDVPLLERPLLAHLVKFQKTIRDRRCQLLVCSLHPDIRRLLEEQGVLRHDEVRNNLVDALRSISLRKVA